MKRLAVIVCCALVAAACSSGESSTTTAPQTTTTLPPTTLPPTTTSTTTLPEVVLPDVDIDDAAEAFRLIMAFADDLSQHPQPELLVDYYDPECSTYGAMADTFNQLADEGWRWGATAPTEVSELVPVSQTDSDAQLIATYTTAAGELYDRQGSLVGTEPEQTRRQGITLTRSDEYGWRICDSVEVIDP